MSTAGFDVDRTVSPPVVVAPHDDPLAVLSHEELRGLIRETARDNVTLRAELDRVQAANLERRLNGELPRRAPLNWQGLSAITPPGRDWALYGWLPMNHAALLAGRGGIGKTLLAQTLGTCLALGIGFIDEVPKPRRVLLWAGEDDHDELWRRQIYICRQLGVDLAGLADKLIVQPFDELDMTLAASVYGTLQPTRLMDQLREQVGDLHVDYVFLDNIARIFGGNENDRHAVTTFTAWTRAACAGTGFCFLGHPGKAVGSEYSGSTAWEGAVRARLYLGEKLPDAERADEEPTDESTRYLCRRKANYSDQDWRRLTYRDGVLVPDDRPAATRYGPQYAQDAVLRAVRTLAGRAIHGNPSTNSPTFLPKLAQQYKLLDGLSKQQFTSAMRDLILAGRLKSDTVGQYANRSPKQALIEVHK